MIIRRLIVPLTVGVMSLHAGQAVAQGAFPAPLPSQQRPPVNDPAFPPVNGSASPFPPANGGRSPFPPVNGASAPSSFPATGAAPITGTNFERAPAPPQAGPQDDCQKGFLTLRDEAEKRGKQIKVASERRAPPEEACKLIGIYSQSEVKMINYIESHTTKCGIPPQIAEQLKTGHKNTENMQSKVCAMAQQQQRGPAGPSLSEVLGSSAGLPDAKTAKKSGGSTFDTLNGNVLSR